MTTYNPDSWQVIKVIPKDVTQECHYRILAGWTGSFMYGNNWKLSSGCERVISEGDYWRVPQSSGSVYILRKNSEQPSMATAGVLESIVQSNHTELLIVKMENILSEFGF